MALLLLPQSRKYGESDVSSPIRPANARDHHDRKDELPDWGAGALRPQPPISLFENVSSLAFISAEDMPEWIKAPSSILRRRSTTRSFKVDQVFSHAGDSFFDGALTDEWPKRNFLMR
ncbi:hypothetical protein HB772_22645 (plasmid) [Sinorhizobium meliloti]|nr:hypothetical protein HB772_22645 [Sinorhizobium meliloti]